MYLSLILLPLLGSVISGFFGRKIGVSGSELITVICVIVTMILSGLTFFEVGFSNSPVFIEIFKWIDSESLNIYWGFNFDAVTVSMLIPVLIVSSLVHVYSIGYMSHDPHKQRFFSYLSLFTFMMIILVTANSFLLMFVGWEGVGICSYLLVNFWFTRIAANQSSVSALLTNRVGDCFLTIGMFVMLLTFGNLDYTTVFSLAAFYSNNIITIIGICILIGAMAKSSQIGLHIWLPMAMEGPTPVSALIHAATMVTAGVYILIRSSPLIEYSVIVLLLCLWIGAITNILSSLIGLFQHDIKKVIAYSTMSQLGMMVIAIGLSSYPIAIFHLVNHAFYKALLFLAAGGVIHAVEDNQDFRKYGGLRPFLPLTYSVMLIASLSLVAIPFMTGFYSKDLILESSYGGFNFSDATVYFIATIGAMFTTLYSVKVLYLTFLAKPNGSLKSYNKAHEGDVFMSIPLIILAIFSIFFGLISKEIFIGLGSNFFSDNSIFIHPMNEIMLNTEFAVPILFKLLPFVITVTLILFSLLIFEFFSKLLIYIKFNRMGYNLFSLFNQRLYIELFYNSYITELILKLGGQTTKVLDKGSIETVGPLGLEKGLDFLSNNISKLDTGVITSYALNILIGLIFYILIPIFNLNAALLIIMIALIGLSYKSKIWTTNLAPKPHIYTSTPLESGIQNIGHKIIFTIIICFLIFVNRLLIIKFFNILNINAMYLIIVLPIFSLLTLMLIKNYKGNTIKINNFILTFIMSFTIALFIFLTKNYSENILFLFALPIELISYLTCEIIISILYIIKTIYNNIIDIIKTIYNNRTDVSDIETDVSESDIESYIRASDIIELKHDDKVVSEYNKDNLKMDNTSDDHLLDLFLEEPEPMEIEENSEGSYHSSDSLESLESSDEDEDEEMDSADASILLEGVTGQCSTEIDRFSRIDHTNTPVETINEFTNYVNNMRAGSDNIVKKSDSENISIRNKDETLSNITRSTDRIDNQADIRKDYGDNDRATSLEQASTAVENYREFINNNTTQTNNNDNTR